MEPDTCFATCWEGCEEVAVGIVVVEVAVCTYPWIHNNDIRRSKLCIGEANMCSKHILHVVSEDGMHAIACSGASHLKLDVSVFKVVHKSFYAAAHVGAAAADGAVPRRAPPAGPEVGKVVLEA